MAKSKMAAVILVNYKMCLSLHHSRNIVFICTRMPLGTRNSMEPFIIGRASLARANEAAGSWGQEVHILHVIGLRFVFGCNNRTIPF